MNTSLQNSVGILILAAILCGCNKHGSVADYIVRVNGEELKHEFMDASINLRLKLQMGGSSAKINIKKVRKALEATAPDKFIDDTIIAQYARDHGLIVDAKTCDRHVKSIRRRLREPYKLTDCEVALLREEILSELLRKVVSADVIKNAQLQVGEVEVRQRREIWDSHNHNAVLTNMLVFARASNVWDRIVHDKLTYNQAYERYDESEDHGQSEFGYWGEFPLQAFESDHDLCTLLIDSHEDSILPPCEGDNGVVIVKVLPSDKTVTECQAGQNLVPIKKYRLSRIFFRMAEVWPDCTDDQLREDLMKIKQNDFLRSFMVKLRQEAKIDWPTKKENAK